MAEWQPIETAPKDGSEVLLAHGNSQWIDQWIVDPVSKARGEEGGLWMMCDQWADPETPTHWKPLSALPDPPERSNESGAVEITELVVVAVVLILIALGVCWFLWGN